MHCSAPVAARTRAREALSNTNNREAGRGIKAGGSGSKHFDSESSDDEVQFLYEGVEKIGDCGEVGVRRRKKYGLDILIDENASQERSCAAQRTRSHFRKSKKLKLGTISQPICLDEDDEEEDETPSSSDLDEEDSGSDEEKSSACVQKRKPTRKNHTSRDFDVLKVLCDSIYGKGEVPRDEEALPSKFSFSNEKLASPEKSGYEKELDEIWAEMDRGLNASQYNSASASQVSSLEEGTGSNGHNRDGSALTRKKHTHDKEDFGVLNILHNSIYAEGDMPLETSGDGPNPNVDLPLKFTFLPEKPKPTEKSEYEKELDALWAEMDYALYASQQNSGLTSQVQNITDSDHDQYPMDEVSTATLCRQGKHHLILDEEIGLICAYCLHVGLEIKYIVPPFIENPCGKLDRRDSCTVDHVDHSVFDELLHPFTGFDDYNVCNYTGTVWDMIPGVKKTMYPHQCEAFEFLWSNLAGSIFLEKLKEQKDFPGASGCIISHAPGTGKTRLTIVFLQTFMELYPACRPMVIAPKGMLLTWEEEFKTWKFDIPFHNLNNSDYSGKESEVAMNLIRNSDHNVSRRVAKLYCRMAKLYSWKHTKSILGISYKLFEQLTQQSSSDKELRKFLLEHPGLLVLDEGHTPRNSNSLIWKAVSEIQTKRRIILSGTPFQNNFNELFNTLCLARPKFAEWKPSGGKVVFDEKQWHPRNDNKGKWGYLTNSFGKVVDDRRRFKILKEIRNMIHPFVHVHKGTILQERLPGLRQLVVILKPSQLQKELLEDIQKKRKGSFNVLKLEYEESVTAVHPVLFNLSEGKEKFKRFRLNPEESSKTKFLMELIRLSGLLNEKVLVFSQFISPLKLLTSQLEYYFSWTEGREVIQMHGKVEAKLRQASIKAFNDPNSKVRVMLASTKACYEGISLVGASRVVLLDVVWNPSVERQAISRAYRLGQKKFVYTYHLITVGTRDEEKGCRQAEKDQLSELVFFNSDGALHCQKISTAELEDEILEEMVQQEKFRHMFEKVAIKKQTLL